MSTSVSTPTAAAPSGDTAAAPQVRGQYRALPVAEEDDLNDEVDLSPTFWESAKDSITHHARRLVIPFLVLVSVAIVVMLIILLAIRPRSGSAAPIGGGPGSGNGDAAPVVIPPGGEGGVYNEIRLPSTIKPVHYELDMATILDGEHNSTFFGSVAVHVNVTTATQFLVIHASGLNLTHSQLTLPAPANASLTPVRHEIHPARSYHVFVFGQTLPVGQAVFHTRFVGQLDRSLRGYYLSKYTDDRTKEDKWIASTQFESTDARRAFPCFDEPALKATFKITMHTQAHLHALSNMPIVKESTRVVPGANKPDKWTLARTFEFDTIPKLSTYLVAFAVTDFEAVRSKTKRGVDVAVWAPPGRAKMGEYAAKVAPLVIDHYEKVFGVEYPLPKSDQIAIPDFAAGAMENWGLITYRDTALLLGPTSTPVNKQRVTTVIAHELGHQWFGNYVTLMWWSELYLNEGFATFCEFIGANAAEPSFDMNSQFYRADQVRAMMADASPHTRPLHADVKDPAEIEGLFDAISYSKGGSILHMIQHYLQDNGHSFFAGVHSYLTAHAWGNAEGTDLWNAISAVAGGANITRVVQEWLNAPGYPLVTVDGDAGVGRGAIPRDLVVHQQRSMGFGNKDALGTLWQIPLTYQVWTNASGTPAPTSARVDSALVTDRTRNLALTPVPVDAAAAAAAPGKQAHWVIKLNVGQHGLFRVALPAPMLDTIAEWWAHDPELFTPLDRAGVFEDAMDRLMAGAAQDYLGSVLALLRPLAKETTYVVWGAAMDRLAMLRRLLERDPEFAQVRRVLAKVVDGVVSDIGWQETEGGAGKKRESEHVRALLRTEILSFAAQVGHAPTLHQAKVLFDELEAATSAVVPESIEAQLALLAAKKRPRKSPLTPALLPVVFDTVVRAGGDAEYAAAERRFNAATLTSDALVYLHAMSQTREPHLIARNVALALSSAVRGQDKVRFLSWVTRSSPVAPGVVADYIEEHWHEFMALLGRGGAFSSATELVEALAASAASPGDMARVRELFDAKLRGELPPNTVPAMDKGLASAAEGVKWKEVVGGKVVAWFKAEAARTA